MNCIQLAVSGMAVLMSLGTPSLARPAAAPVAPADPSVFLYDSADAPSAAGAGSWLAKQPARAPLEEDLTAHPFMGHAVMMNDRLVAVLAPGSAVLEVYARQTQGAKLGARLQPVGKSAHPGETPGLGTRAGEVEPGPEVKRTSLVIRENSRASVVLEVEWIASGNDRCRITYTLQAGQPFIQTTAGPGVEKLRVHAPCRFAVLPDFFGDDIVVDAARLPVEQAELPSENFLLHLMHEGEALLLTVSESRDNDIAVRLANTRGREILSSDLAYGGRPHIWIAMLAGQGVWHQRAVQTNDAGQILALDWSMPFPALWRVDWSKSDQLNESWEMLLQAPDGKYVMQNWFGQKESEGQSFGKEFGPRDWNKPDRQRWNPVLGAFKFPCWVERSGRGYLQPLEAPRNRAGEWPAFAGPAIVYPLDRLAAAPFQTPLDQLTLVDLVRLTLGVGPCQYILDLEGQKRNSRGVATCYARDVINAIYKEGSQLNQGPVIEENLTACVAFIRNVRERIDQYVQFARELTAELQAQKLRSPQQAVFLDECLALLKKLDDTFEQNRAKIHTPSYAQDHADRFRTDLLHDAGPEAFSKCERHMAGFTSIGGAQDDLVAACRMYVKILRQRAGMALALQPELKECATRIRQRTQSILRNPTAYEAPRH